MTWTTFHRRGDVLREVVATANARQDGHLPLDVDGVAACFEDELALVGALQLKWHTRLAGRIDRALGDQPVDLPGAVTGAWGDAQAELPGVRLLLDRHRDHPTDERMAEAMAKATRKEHAWLATMAGLAGINDDARAVAAGAALEQRARAAYPLRPAVARIDEPRPTLLERLRSVLAA